MSRPISQPPVCPIIRGGPQLLLSVASRHCRVGDSTYTTRIIGAFPSVGRTRHITGIHRQEINLQHCFMGNILGNGTHYYYGREPSL